MKTQEGLVRMESKNAKAALRAARVWGRVSLMIGVENADAVDVDNGEAA
jgi:hypothetical protein